MTVCFSFWWDYDSIVHPPAAKEIGHQIACPNTPATTQHTKVPIIEVQESLAGSRNVNVDSVVWIHATPTPTELQNAQTTRDAKRHA